MKLGGVTKLEKRNKNRTKKKKCKILKDGVMLENCDVTVMLNSRCIVCTAYIFINSNLLSYKTGKQN